jgi:Alpha amylase, catalytic domain/Carbohydrate-binding module 48 (Isoamylase N-terminal domain)/Secretion system C-terminal sorting domain
MKQLSYTIFPFTLFTHYFMHSLSKKALWLCFCLLLLGLGLDAQVTCTPVFPNTDDDVTIVFHADEGNNALAGFAGPVYAHTGVITNQSQSPSDWKYVQTTWGQADPDGLMTNTGTNEWSKTFNIRDFYGVPQNETVLRIAFVFRNLDGSVVGRTATGGDIFYDVYPDDGQLRTKFVQPSVPSFITQNGASIPVNAYASEPAGLILTDNGAPVAATNGENLPLTLTALPGFHEIVLEATANNQVSTAMFTYLVPNDVVIENPPTGTELGVNYLNESSVRLALNAPNKQNVFLIGDMNDWAPDLDYQMKRSVDGTIWWIDLVNLTPGEGIRYQYLVDGSLKIADPLSALVLDPWNDAFIPSVTFPNLPSYPADKTTGIVTWIQPGAAPFNWQTTEYERPKKTDLVIYELLMRDFLARHDFPTLLDTLDYLEKLGVTAIQLMPVNEFDGNISWGYSPAFHNALDKYYGTPEQFKTFVDECHNRDIAVIVDVVFNHATGNSPLAQLFWDSANNQPAADNPWLNPTAKHPFNVFNDFNHESQATKAYTKRCLEYWMNEYRIDGYRFDLSKGFTQVNSGSNVGQWGQYDASRVAIWKDYADFMWAIDPEFYVILEHFADNAEEKELANYGMMFWGNIHFQYKDVALGTSTGLNTSLTSINYKTRGWDDPHLVGYMESHDEERIAYECKNFGFTAPGGGYNVKSLPTALKRIEALNNLMYPVPGPKMIWQFGEMGYDFSINYCPNGTVNNNCRTDPKPIRWDYLDDPYRNRLRNVTTALLQLRKNYDIFETTDYSANIGSGAFRNIILRGPDLKVVVVANVGVTAGNATALFPNVGTWYDYYTGQTIEVTSATTNTLVPLEAGDYRLFTNQIVPLPDGVVISSTREKAGFLNEVAIAPNPVGERTIVWLTLSDNSALQVNVVNTQGQLVQQINVGQLPAGDHAIEIESAEWPTGVYYVQLIDENGNTLTRKAVK